MLVLYKLAENMWDFRNQGAHHKKWCAEKEQRRDACVGISEEMTKNHWSLLLLENPGLTSLLSRVAIP